MTRDSLKIVVFCISAFYFLLVVVFFQLDPEGPTIQVMRYVLPILVAIPAAILVEAFRRYSAFQTALIDLYYSVVDDVQTALIYTKKDQPTEAEYFKTLSDLSRSIDRIRAHFRNINAPGAPEGYYPFEGVKTLFLWIEYLGAGQQWKGRSAADETRRAILDLWKYKIRNPLLRELDRHMPTEVMSPYLGDDMWQMPPDKYLQVKARPVAKSED